MSCRAVETGAHDEKGGVQTSAQVKCHDDEKKCWHQSWDLINEQIYTGSPIDAEWQTLEDV